MIIERPFPSWAQFKRDFRESLDQAGPVIENYVFRGQADARWGIESSFDRICPKSVKNRDRYYRKMLAFFVYQLRQYGEDLDGKTRQDRGAIAQHYGMPTRLIDWSRSPYVAAFMAFYAALTEDRIKLGSRVAIWAIDVQLLGQLCGDEDSGFEIVKTRLVENDRVWRQSGLFVEATGSENRLDKWIERATGKLENEHSASMIKYTIPGDQAAEVLNDLILMGLTPATIYPDRDGAAKYVRLRVALDSLQEHERPRETVDG